MYETVASSAYLLQTTTAKTRGTRGKIWFRLESFAQGPGSGSLTNTQAVLSFGRLVHRFAAIWAQQSILPPFDVDLCGPQETANIFPLPCSSDTVHTTAGSLIKPR